MGALHILDMICEATKPDVKITFVMFLPHITCR